MGAVPIRSNEPTLAAKLALAREATGHSTRTIVELMPAHLRVSHTTIANYESGRSKPSTSVLSVLATIYERPLNWFLDGGPTLSGIRYRNIKSRVTVSGRHRFELGAQQLIEAYIRVESHVGRVLEPSLDSSFREEQSSGERLAQAVRERLGVGAMDPLPSVVDVLEQFGVRTLEMETDLSIDGLAARFGVEHVVVLNRDVPNDRYRMNAAHELGHVLLHDCESDESSTKRREDRAYDFASHLILSNGSLKRAFETQSMIRLRKFKEQFGISMAAMIYRAEKQRFIRKSVAKRLWVEFSRRGWRKNEPGEVHSDRATRFEQIVDEAISTKKLTWPAFEAITSIPASEMKERLGFAMDGVRPNADGDLQDPRILKFTK